MKDEITDDDILTDINEMWDAADTFASMYETRWAKNKRLVNSKHLTARKAGQSSLFIPKIESYHSRKLADYVGAFGGDDPVGLKPTMTSTKNGAAIMSQVINHYISDAGGIAWDAAVLNGAHDSLTYNYAPWFLDWDRSTAEVETEDGVEEVELYSHPTLKNIPPEDIRIDPAVGWNDIGMARFAIVREYVDRVHANRMAEQGLWERMEDEDFADGELSMSTGVLAQERSQSGIAFSDSSNLDNGLAEIWHSFYYDEDTDEPVRCISLKGQKILQPPTPLEFDLRNSDGSDPFPLGVGRIYAEPHEQHSRAMPEKLESLQVEANAIRNQRRDNVALALNSEKFMTPEAGIDPAVLSRSFAGKVNVVKSRNSVWWERAPDVTQSAYNEEQVTVSDMDSLVAESAHRQGVSTKSRETATEVKLMASNTSQAMGLDHQVFAMTFTNDIVNKLIRMIRQAADPVVFETAARHLRMEVEDPYEEALTGDFRVTVGNGAAQAVRDIAISNASNMAAIIQSIYGQNANYYKIMAPMLEANGFRPSDIIIDPSQPQNQPHPSQMDAGGVQEGVAPLTVQPNVALSGGQFGGGQ